MKLTWTSLALALLIPAAASAQLKFENAVRKIETRFVPAEAKPGQTVALELTIELNEGWYTYPTFQPDEFTKNSVNKIVLPPPGDIVFVEPVRDPAGYKSDKDPDGEYKDKRYYTDKVTWSFPAVVSPKVTVGVKKIELKKLSVLVCVKQKKPDGKYQENCLPPKPVSASTELKVTDGPPVAVEQKYRYVVNKAGGLPNPEDALAMCGGATGILALAKEPEIKREADESKGEKKQVGLRINKDRDYRLDLEATLEMLPKVEASNKGFVAFIVTAMFWGAVTLLTPCVFPMVPITVSFFLKQGEKKQHSPLAMALVYTLTIIAVLGIAAMFFLSFFRKLSVDPWMNVALGVLFVVFAMSLFGMFDIVLPSFLVRFTSAREGRGGYGGVIFMALSFSIVSFTCVAPFLGGFAGMAASGNFSDAQLLAGALAFASTFAAPFFLLALFPSLLKKLPKSGGWMNTIKVVMGFLELAAALKFFRNAELRWTIPPVLFTYDFVLSMWVVLLFLCGLYLLNLYRLPHDAPQDHIGVPRMLFGFLTISLAVYLLPGLFKAGNEKQRPAGTIYAWVDAFLLPEPSAAEVIGGGDFVWSADLKGTIEAARAANKTVLIDFTGVTCTNCKLNEKQVFPRPAVKEVMKEFLLVQMYTDTIPPEFYEAPPDNEQRDRDAIANLEFQKKAFGTEQLPLYVLLRPEPGVKGGAVKIIAIYDEGKINSEASFVEFLKKGVVK
jgi:thiol:disulfide interchange protein